MQFLRNISYVKFGKLIDLTKWSKYTFLPACQNSTFFSTIFNLITGRYLYPPVIIYYLYGSAALICL